MKWIKTRSQVKLVLQYRQGTLKWFKLVDGGSSELVDKASRWFGGATGDVTGELFNLVIKASGSFGGTN